MRDRDARSVPDGDAGGLPTHVRGTVATVGTFDGVHRGHLKVLWEIGRRARARSLASVLVTFDRHPLEVVRPDEAPPLLTTPEEKREFLARSPLDYVAILPFTEALSRYRPEEFVRGILVERFRVRELVIGHDHGFGRGRSGDIDTLRRLGAEIGFDVDVVDEVTVEGRPVSSTSIRKAIRDGDVAMAARFLGRPYSFRGSVVRGQGKGRELGFPTANLQTADRRKLLPPEGIYAVRASLRSEIRQGLLHLGPRPTFPGAPPSVELHILDFERDIYGRTVGVELLDRLRSVRHFQTAEELVEQMRRDRRAARALFAGACE